MKKDKHKTKVSFWMEPEIKEDNNKDSAQYYVMAFFPEIDYTREVSGMKTCYAHYGQHSACHIDYLKECRPATPEEYKELANELESIGYNLDIN